jgi:hypothetical protein
MRIGKIGAAKVEITDDVEVQNVLHQNPTLLLWAIPLPVHQILEPTSPVGI